MVIFAIDTSGNQPNAAVAANGKIVASATGASENSTEELAELASRTLALSKLSFDDISEICVSIGPGSFTGIRTGVSFAQGIRQALGIKLFGLDCVTSLFFLTDQMNTPGKSEALLRANSKEFFHRFGNVF